MNLPENIQREHLLKAIEKIDAEGVPSDAHSTLYDVVFNNKQYPPKLVVSWANIFANGTEFDRDSFEGGYHTPCFRLLANKGFSVERKDIQIDETDLEFFTREEFSTLDRVHGQARDSDNAQQNIDFDILKKAYDKTKYWMDQVEKNLFPGGDKKIRRGPLNQAGNFHGYNWAKIYPSQHAKEIASLAYTVGIDYTNGFVVKIDTVNESGRKRELYEEYMGDRNSSRIWLTIPVDEGIELKWGDLIEKSIDYLRSIEPHYRKLDAILGYGIYDDKNYHNDIDYGATTKSKSSMPESNLFIPLNQILYGPPGTGKTFNSINKSLEILDPDFLINNMNDRSALKSRFDELRQNNRIHFVTFHQSFSYEDFVEGLRAESINGQVEYKVEAGIFMQACDSANHSVGKGSVDDVVNDFLEELESSSIHLKTPTGKSFTVTYKGNTTFSCVPESSIEKRELPANIEHIKQVLKGRNPTNIYCESYVNGIVNHLRPRLATKINLYQGQKFNDYEVVSLSDEVVNIRKPNGKILPYPMSILNELRNYVLQGDLDISDLKDKRWQTKINSNIEPYFVNGYDNLVWKIVEYLVDNSSTQSIERSTQPVVLIIDEINRGNISSIFGELITLIEESKREGRKEELSVLLPYSKVEFKVPSNLYIIGTMNTADRSLALMDTALRRRFEFVEMMPITDVLNGVNVNGIDIESMLLVMNKRIELLYDREHTLGHAFFINLKYIEDDNVRFEALASIFSNKIIPLLEEYFFEDWKKIRLVLADNQANDENSQFILLQSDDDYNISSLFGDVGEYDLLQDDLAVYVRNPDALKNPMAYKKIYETN